MKNNKDLDRSIILLIGYFLLLALTFNYFIKELKVESYFMFTFVMIIGLCSYFLSRTSSLLLVLVFDFLYTSFNFYLSIVSDHSLGIEVYYWIIIIPITALVVGTLANEILKVEKAYEEAVTDKERFTRVDVKTGLRNYTSFMEELPIYINIGKRHKIPVTLIYLKIKYMDRLTKILGEEKYNEILVNYANSLEYVLRHEDRKYIVDKDTFAFIVVSNNDGAKVVKDKLKESIHSVEVLENKRKELLNLELQIGVYTMNDDIKDAMDFVTKVEKEVLYDV